MPDLAQSAKLPKHSPLAHLRLSAFRQNLADCGLAALGSVGGESGRSVQQFTARRCRLHWHHSYRSARTGGPSSHSAPACDWPSGHHCPKVDVVSSTLIARSIFSQIFWMHQAALSALWCLTAPGVCENIPQKRRCRGSQSSPRHRRLE